MDWVLCKEVWCTVCMSICFPRGSGLKEGERGSLGAARTALWLLWRWWLGRFGHLSRFLRELWRVLYFRFHLLSRLSQALALIMQTSLWIGKRQIARASDWTGQPRQRWKEVVLCSGSLSQIYYQTCYSSWFSSRLVCRQKLVISSLDGRLKWVGAPSICQQA